MHPPPHSNNNVPAQQGSTSPYPSVQPLAADHVTTTHGAAYPSVQPLAHASDQHHATTTVTQQPYPPNSAAALAGDMQRLNVQQHAPAGPSSYPYPQMQPQQQQQHPSYPSPQHSGSGNSSHYYCGVSNSSSTSSPYPPGSFGSGGNSQHPYSASSTSSPYPSGINSFGHSDSSNSYQTAQQQPSLQHAPYGSFGAAHSSSSLSSSSAAAGGVLAPSPYPATGSLTGGGGGGSGGSFGSQQLQQQQQQQQQQRAEPLPPYPKVPTALLPVMSYNVAPEKVSQGYDVLVYIQGARNLPAMDWWNRLADPFCIVTSQVGDKEFQYKTAHKRRTVNPDFDEWIQLGNLPAGTTFFIEVWDKDLVTDDDVIGRASWCFNPKDMLPASTAGGGLLSEDPSWGRLLLELPLKHPSKAKKSAGEVMLEICYRPSTRNEPPRMLGPVRFRQHLSPTAGALTGHWWSNEDTLSFTTFKLFLTNISAVFDGVSMPWNRKYDKAVAIFKNPVVLSGLRTQHSALYSTLLGNSRGGVLSTAADFFELFKYGMRDGQRRFFTYVLCEDSFRCSETGAAFFSDMFSKHAMHSGAAEEVLYAGEFCIMPCPEAEAGHKLVIDNNSGTYAPDKTKLPLMQKLFTQNFRGMTVEAIDMKDPLLKEYQLACPSRSGLTGAAAEAAAAAASAAGGDSSVSSRRSKDGSAA